MIAHTLSRAESTLHKALRATLNHEMNDDEFVAAIRGACTEEEFLDAVASQIRTAPESTSGVMSLMHRLSWRGEVRASSIRRLESLQSGCPPSDLTDGITIELADAAGSSQPAGAEPIPTGLEVGTILRNRYLIEECLGNGGKGSVFKALDYHRSGLPTGQQYLAIKVLHQGSDSSEDMSRLLRRELQCSQALSHPNVVKVFDLDRDGSLDFLTMELLEGELLSSLLTRYRPAPMPRSHAWSIIRQIAAGLQHAHERGIVHADLKPQNIYVTNSGEVRILDFGASHALTKDADGGAERATSLTLAYASCELLERHTPDPRDDLYALACVSYELLAGTHPFRRRCATEAKRAGMVAARPRDLSRRQWDALSGALSWQRAGRTMSVSDWISALDPGTKESLSLRDMQPAKEASKPSNAPALGRKLPYVRVIAAALLFIAGVAWLLFAQVAPKAKPAREELQTASPSARAPLDSTPESSLGATEKAQAPAQPIIETPQTAGDGALPAALRSVPQSRFAEVRIRRPTGVTGDTPFVWWTEGASAKPGIDFVNQPKATQHFSAGTGSTSVFVKLLPRPSGSSAGVFYVMVAGAGDHDPKQVAHIAVRVPVASL
jgi:hypothetical protein